MPKEKTFGALFERIRSFQSPLFEKAELIDLYLYQQDNEEKRNATFRFTYRDPLKTISFEEAEAIHAKLMEYVTTT